MFNTVRIRDLGRVITGSTPSTKVPENFGKGYPFVKPPDLDDNIRRVLSTESEISEVGCKTQASRLVPGDTTCVVCIGTIGKIGLTTRPSFTNQQINSVVADRAKYDPIFVYYLLRNALPRIKQQDAGSASGRENVNKSSFEDIEVDVPPLPLQRKIASILSPYDDLVENSIRRIMILDEMSRLIYREWFVNFHFPGHARAKISGDSSIGKIPDDWKVTRVADIAATQRGLAYRGRHLVEEGGSPFISLKCINRDGGFRTDGLKRYKGPYKESHTAKCGDIVIALTDMSQERKIVAHAARVPRLDEMAIFSMDLAKVLPKYGGIPPAYLYGLLRFSAFPDTVKQYANGVNVLHLSPERIGEFAFPLPPESLICEYADVAQSLQEQRNILEKENEYLLSTRDLLIPNLLSGKIPVHDIDLVDVDPIS